MAQGQPDETIISERLFATLLFCDICGSTRLAAHLDPDVYADLLESVRAIAETAISREDGQVTQIYGDGLLAVFRDANSPQRAISAARALHAEVAELRLAAGAPAARLLLHSGVHAGLVLLRTGDAARGRLEALGRPTGIAARLAAAAAPDEILVTRGSLGPVANELPLGPMRLVSVSGSDDVVEAVAVLGKTIAGSAGLKGPSPKRPFIGRQAIMSEIQQLIRAATPPFIAVVAPGGMGKSRLADSVAAWAEAEGWRVARGNAEPVAPAAPLQIWRAIDWHLPGAVQVAAQLDQQPELRPDDILARVRATADAEPLLLILDDWHWSDSVSMDVLSRLRDASGRPAVLLLSRESSFHGLDLPVDKLIILPPFTLQETTELVAVRQPELDPLDAARIHARAGGNPLFATELMKLPPGALQGPMVPDGVDDSYGWLGTLIAARIGHLPPGSRELLFAAAAIGFECPIWLLAMLTGSTADTPALCILEEADLLVVSADPGWLRFAHGITWEVTLSLMPFAERRALHRSLGNLLAGHAGLAGPARDEALARHFLLGGNEAKAAHHAARAGDHAESRGAVDRAQAWYAMALDALLKLPAAGVDRALFARVVGRFGYCCIFDAEDAHLDLLARAATRAAGYQDAETEAEIARWSALILHGQGKQREAERQCRSAIDKSCAPEGSRTAVQLRAILGEILASAGRYDEGAPLLAESIRIKRQKRSGRNPSPGLAYALALEGAMLGDLGQFDAAWDRIHIGFDMLNGAPHPVEGSIIGWACAILAWQERWVELAEMACRGCRIAQRIETVYVHAVCRAFEAFARYRMQPGDQPADQLGMAVACMEQRGKGLALSMAHGFMAEVAAERSDMKSARFALLRAYARHRLGEPFGLAQAARAWAGLVAGSDPPRARLFMARARRNARFRRSEHELAKIDLAEARLGLDGPVASKRLAHRAAAAFSAMGMQAAAMRAGAISEPAGDRVKRAQMMA